MLEFIYLDNGATTWPKPDIVHERMSSFYRDFGVNPGRAGYDRAMEAEETVQQCRKRLTAFFNGDDSERLIFTYNATDALNQVIQGRLTNGGHVISTTLEHNSVIRPLNHMDKRSDVEVTWLEFREGGFIDPDDVRKAIKSDTKLVMINHGSNVIGTAQDVGAIGKICREEGVFFAIDASQTAGVVPIDMKEMCIDAVCFTGHKSLFGPTGIGGICVAKDANIEATRWGGTGVKSILKYHLEEYPYRLEAGTMNTMGVAGLLAGQDFIESRGGAEAIHEYEMKLMRKLWEAIKDIDRVTLYCADSLDGHIPVLSMNVEGFEAINTGAFLDVDYNIATRTGLHCAPLVHEQMHTAEIGGTVRFSFGPFNTEEHVDAAIHAVGEIVMMSKGWTKSINY